MTIRLVRGDEPMIQEALKHLRERYGIPKDDIQRLEIDAETGQPMRLTVTLLVREPAEVKVEPLGLTEQQRNVSDMHEAIERLVCSTCLAPVRPKDMERHMARVHPDLPRPYLTGPSGRNILEDEDVPTRDARPSGRPPIDRGYLGPGVRWMNP